jgi:hypothetical protein
VSFKVDAAAIMRCGEEVGGLVSTAEKIKADATKATVPETSWGLLGQALTYSDYVELQTGFLEHMDKIVQKMGDLGDRLTLTGQDYQDVDHGMRDALEALGTRLGQASAPPKVGG